MESAEDPDNFPLRAANTFGEVAGKAMKNLLFKEETEGTESKRKYSEPNERFGNRNQPFRLAPEIDQLSDSVHPSVSEETESQYKTSKLRRTKSKGRYIS